ncbi:MAG: hypothetical protein KKG96_06245 [Proteobacteria bacterium]|nr:hypothetical protein [Pseudomonadota bacterium]MBU1965640.1 hypothetical protein [Pseudomonadota bacterium]
MNKSDDFGHDPTVQKTRNYFAQMESMDSKLIERSGISLFDPRLRDGRDMRFKLFETTCSLAVRKGHRLDECVALELFDLCQEMAFKTCGLPVSPSDRPLKSELMSLIKEAL